MPVYEYQCKACQKEFEYQQRMSDPDKTDCEACGQPALERLISRTAFTLKGSGWYKDLYSSAKPEAAKGVDASSSGDAGASSSSSDSSGTSGSSGTGTGSGSSGGGSSGGSSSGGSSGGSSSSGSSSSGSSSGGSSSSAAAARAT